MSDVADPAVMALLAEARRQFAASLVVKTAELVRLLEAEAWADARRAAHKLRGSSGTYGFAALCAALGDIEEALLDSPNLGLASPQRTMARAREATVLAEQAAKGDP